MRPSGGTGRDRLVAVLLLGLVILLAVTRAYSWNEPIERDIGFYAAVGHELALGSRLYSDVWDHYLPGITSTYMVAELVFGYGPLQLYALWLLASLLTLMAVFRASRSLEDGGASAWVGLLGACLYAIVAGDVMLQANQPNTEIFMNVCLAGAFAILATARGRLRGIRPEAVGLLLATAILYKQVAIFVAVGLVLAHAAAPATRRRSAVLESGRMAAAGLSVGVALLVYVASSGRFDVFWDNVILFSLHWASLNSGETASMLQFSRLWIPEARALAPLALMAVAGLPWARPRSRVGVLMSVWLATTWLAISAPGTFFPHYYQLAIPPLVVASAWSISAWRRHAPRAAVGLGTVVVSASILLQLPYYATPPREWPLLKYGDYGQLFIDAQSAGALIGDLLEPDEELWQWGSEPQLYFYSGRRPGASVLLLFAMESGPVARSLNGRVLGELRADPPALIVLHPLHGLPTGSRIAGWIQRRYRPLTGGDVVEPFQLLARRGWQPRRAE